MKYIFLIVFFISLASFKVFASGNGGDVVNNGGGLSEQAFMYAAFHYTSFLENCLQSSACGGDESLRSALEKVQSCPLPRTEKFQFKTPSQEPVLTGRIYLEESSGAFIVNREMLYSGKTEPLRFPTAMGFLSRIYLDRCHVVSWEQSLEFVKPLVAFADFDGEHITIGKDNVRLPKAQWIHVRSLFSDLLIETPEQVLSISCEEGSLAHCGFGRSKNNSLNRFKYLSLVKEELVGEKVIFLVEGVRLFPNRENEFFNLLIEIVKGRVQRAEWMGQTIPLPL